MIKIVLSIVALALSIPVGFLISSLTKDELKQGRAWFRALFILSVCFGVWFVLIGIYHIALTIFFIGIVALISFLKSG